MRQSDHTQQRTAAEDSAETTPESLKLRGRPAPIRTINRTVLIGVATLILLLLAAIVIAALDPPSFRTKPPPVEVYAKTQKRTADGLQRVPSTYDGLLALKKDEHPPPAGSESTPPLIAAVPSPGANDPELKRAASQSQEARESPLFFRLELKDRLTATASQAARGADVAKTPEAPPNPSSSLFASTSALADVLAADGTITAQGPPREQTRKLSFLEAAPVRAVYNSSGLETPASPYQLMAGTIIPASLVSGLNSDLPGFVIAQVTEHVYDTVTGHHLLVPQGTRLVGRYDNVIAFAQERALVVWQRMILPNGTSVVIDNLPATDTAGYAGLSDNIDFHTWKLVKGIALATLIGVGTELSFGSAENDLVQALRDATQQNVSRAGQRVVDRNLDVQPTLTVRPGWPLRVIVHKDIVLRPYSAEAAKDR